ncbi:MAG: CrcB family protein [Acidimicrobiia bacterium]|nr:CrcB family protein [Acidimicrobiia bacterium]
MSRLGKLPLGHRVAVAVAGALGAAVRWAVVDDAALLPVGVPWRVLWVNAAACALAGVVVTAAVRGRWSVRRRDVAVVGFCGGLSTFSTVAVELAHLGRTGDWFGGGAYLGASVGVCVVAYVVAASLTGRLAPGADPDPGVVRP